MVEFDSEEYLSRLKKKAMEDGILTEEEANIIQTNMKNFERYQTLIEEALEDNIITDDEKVELYKFRTKIFEDNLKLINEDNIMTDDETELLVIIQRILRELRELEDDYR